MVAKDHGSTDTRYATATTTRNGTRYLTFDRAELLTGATARAAKAANGLDPDDAPSFFIPNDRPEAAHLPAERSGQGLRDAAAARSGTPRPISMKHFLEFAGSRKASAHTPFTLTFKGAGISSGSPRPTWRSGREAGHAAPYGSRTSRLCGQCPGADRGARRARPAESPSPIT